MEDAKRLPWYSKAAWQDDRSLRARQLRLCLRTRRALPASRALQYLAGSMGVSC